MPAPIVFGRLTDGLATAESDFRPGPEKAPLHQVILQMGGSFQSTVTIGQEYYRGGSGRSCNSGICRWGTVPGGTRPATGFPAKR